MNDRWALLAAALWFSGTTLMVYGKLQAHDGALVAGAALDISSGLVSLFAPRRPRKESA